MIDETKNNWCFLYRKKTNMTLFIWRRLFQLSILLFHLMKSYRLLQMCDSRATLGGNRGVDDGSIHHPP